MMGFGTDGLLGGMGGVGMLVGPLVWVALVALLVWGAGTLFGGRPERETPLEILRRRYAAGEIDQADYEQSRRTLA